MRTIPQIPQDAIASGGNYLKPESLGLKMGTRVTFKITAPHKESSNNGKKINNIPVSTDYKFPTPPPDMSKIEFPLNKTNMGYLVKGYKSNNSDTWVGHSFDGLVIPQKNPQTNAPVLSWTIDTESIK